MEWSRGHHWMCCKGQWGIIGSASLYHWKSWKDNRIWASADIILTFLILIQQTNNPVTNPLSYPSLSIASEPTTLLLHPLQLPFFLSSPPPSLCNESTTSTINIRHPYNCPSSCRRCLKPPHRWHHSPSGRRWHRVLRPGWLDGVAHPPSARHRQGPSFHRWKIGKIK